MDYRSKLITAAEQLFNRQGFNATGMDDLAKEAGMSSRTLYKHAGSKTSLITSVLAERDQRFMTRLDASSVDAIFQTQAEWLEEESSRGCLFLRAHGETGGDTAEISAAMTAHKARFREQVAQAVERDIGRHDDELTEQILILFEGATAAAAYRGKATIAVARRAAATLIQQARP